MVFAFRAVGSALGDLWLRLIPCVGGNVIAFLLSAPIFLLLLAAAAATQSLLVLVLGVVVFVGMLPNPAMAGLQAMFFGGLNREPLVGMAEQMAGLRALWRLALRAWVLAAAVTVVLIANVVFYATHRFAVSGALEVLWAVAVVFWLAMQVPVYSLLLEMEEPRVLLAYRNAALIAVTRPLTVVLVLIMWVVVLGLSAFTGIIGILGMAAGAAIQQHVGYGLLRSFEWEGAEA